MGQLRDAPCAQPFAVPRYMGHTGPALTGFRHAENRPGRGRTGGELPFRAEVPCTQRAIRDLGVATSLRDHFVIVEGAILVMRNDPESFRSISERQAANGFGAGTTDTRDRACNSQWNSWKANGLVTTKPRHTSVGIEVPTG